ncbi:hypothetical protein JN11_00567 [Mucilaginibacter frigoritolerans]|uniref:Uncharacterized protein n=1 Tax=Mucilaginibacter frigoritolerans TaxID=652788 RepID=A0A562UGA4_9SPHI|nr:hypothetical protein [Mucilaginibacter frigoritolerans]TWJ04844.1 hypothetical protein JN11_00567 [Mucilaginibacter frigoritolerans]
MLYQYFVYQSDRFFNEQISKNRYNVSDLVEIKVPIHTSAAQNWKRYESINGQVQFKNTCYNYVKLKLTADTIYLKCIPNYEKTRLFNQNIINAKAIADIPVNKNSHVPFGKVNFSITYNATASIFNFNPPLAIANSINTHICCYIIEHSIPLPEHPPKELNPTSC